MKLALYTIESEYRLLSDQIIANGGEVTEAEEAALQLNRENLETKSTAYGFITKELDYEIEVIDAEIKRLGDLKKSRVKTIDKLKERVSEAMHLYGIEEIKTPVMKINFRKSETVEIDNMAQLDQKFMVEKVTVSPDKTKIKEAIKAGETVEGARIETHQNIQIK
jgi:hypothetical protein